MSTIKRALSLLLLIACMSLDQVVEIPAQKLNATERTGFTVFKWGGCVVR